ncbi:MAG: transposase, partial [Deinococcota bacterium]|nr:transposase [Deinococcota bacterium]
LDLQAMGPPLDWSWSIQVDSSTITEFTAQQLVRRYSVRFQVEFLIRDAKQFTGLSDCQARNQAAIHFHLNASLVAVNLARLEARQNHDAQQAFVFSLASLKHRAFNTHLLDLIIERFDLKPTSIKSHPSYPDLCAYGTLAA